MPKALGEFGKGKHSDVNHKVIQVIESSEGIVKFRDIWMHVVNDLESMPQLATILQNLVAAQKIQVVPGNQGFLANRKALEYADSSLYDPSLLTEEERKMTL
jgi:hypothetical protein